MFYSHLPEAYGMTPYVVHSTFQRYNNAGKVARFREAGAYLVDDSSYYTEGNYLVYDNLVLEYIEAIERLAHGNLTQVPLPFPFRITCTEANIVADSICMCDSIARPEAPKWPSAVVVILI